jgi:hypothetical protein
MPLNSLGIQIERHWRELRPKMVADLEREGRLEAAIKAAQDLTATAEARARETGMTSDQARDRCRNLWAFLPSEEDVSDLGTDPARWSTAASCHEAHTGWCTGKRVEAWRAALKMERDEAVARVKRRLSDPGNAGVPHATFIAQHYIEVHVCGSRRQEAVLRDVRDALERITRSLLGKEA